MFWLFSYLFQVICCFDDSFAIYIIELKCFLIYMIQLYFNKTTKTNCMITEMYDNLYFNKQSELTQEMVQLSRLLSWFPWFPSSSWWSPAHRCRWRVRGPQRSAVSYSEPVLWIGQTRNDTYNFAIFASTFTISETRNNVSFV